MNFSGCNMPLRPCASALVPAPVTYNCYPGEAYPVNLADYDFKSLPDGLGNDGTSSFQPGNCNSSGYLQIASSPYNIYSSDHAKYYREIGNAFAINPAVPYYRFAVRMASAQTFDLDNLIFQQIIGSGRVRSIADDLRLASSGAGLIDNCTGISAGFLLTNDSIYGFYQRDPDQRNLNGNNNYAGFFSAKWLAGRDNSLPLEDYANLELQYDNKNNTLHWYINNDRLWTIARIGVRAGEDTELIDYGGAVEQEVKLKSLVGFIGNFDFLDAALPNNYSRSLIGPLPDNSNNSALVQLRPVGDYAQIDLNVFGVRTGITNLDDTFFYNDNGPTVPDQVKLFGQGAIARFASIALSQLAQNLMMWLT